MRNKYDMDVVRVLVSDPDYYDDDKLDNVIHPLRHVRVILENGLMFYRPFNCMTVDEAFVEQNFNEETDKWEEIKHNTERKPA